MKKPEFVNLIREIVKEEVRKCFPQMLAEIALSMEKNNDKNKERLQESSLNRNNIKPIQNNSNNLRREREKVTFTSNSMLNDVLNETTAFSTEQLGYSGNMVESSGLNYMTESNIDNEYNLDNHLAKNGLHENITNPSSVNVINTDKGQLNLGKTNFRDILKKANARAESLRGNN